jgi:hypothetical protein
VDYHTTGIRWVLVDGALRSIEDYAHLRPGKRPKPVFCPQCKARVVMQLGPVKAHHSRHHRSSDCPATAEETARHLNTKFHLAAMLKGASRLDIVRGCRTCTRTVTQTWVEGWSDVHVEHRLEPLRPDIVLMGLERPYAIEVFATSKVSPHKQEKFAEMGVEWIEVRAEEHLYEGASPWNASQPLRAIQTSEAPTCPECVVRLAEEARDHARREEFDRQVQEQARIYHEQLLAQQAAWEAGKAQRDAEQAILDAKRLERERLNRLEFLTCKVYDVYLPNGAWRREPFVQAEQYEDGKPRSRQIMRVVGGRVIAEYRSTDADGYAMANARFKAHLAGYGNGKAITDSPMKWARFPEDPAKQDQMLDVMMARPRGSYMEACLLPTRWRFGSATKAWYMPSNLARITWDRHFEAFLSGEPRP